MKKNKSQLEIITTSKQETQRKAFTFASKLSGGELIGLKGELGSGKTTWLKGLAKGLGIKKEIISPSFILLKKYKTSVPQIPYLYHLDLYRLKEKKEIQEIGIEDLLNKKGVVAIEWIDHAPFLLKMCDYLISFYLTSDPLKRKIIIRKFF